MGHGLALLGEPEAQLAAGVGLPVERLGDGGGAAQLAEREHVDLEVAAVVLHTQSVAGVNLAGGLGGLAVGCDSAEFTGREPPGRGF